MSASPEAARHLLLEYGNWLSIERQRVMRDLGLDPRRDSVSLYGPAYDWHEAHAEAPAARASTVLDAVGVEWRAA